MFDLRKSYLSIVRNETKCYMLYCAARLLFTRRHDVDLISADIIHKYVRDVYYKRFPELESLVPQPLEYMRTVMVRIGQHSPV